jgi:hypothetical protein
MQLGFDPQNVIALRMMQFAAGGIRGRNEARRMVADKVAAGAEAQVPQRLASLQVAWKPLSPGKSFKACMNGFARTNADYLGSNSFRKSPTSSSRHMVFSGQ